MAGSIAGASDVAEEDDCEEVVLQQLKLRQREIHESKWSDKLVKGQVSKGFSSNAFLGEQKGFSTYGLLKDTALSHRPASQHRTNEPLHEVLSKLFQVVRHLRISGKKWYLLMLRIYVCL